MHEGKRNKPRQQGKSWKEKGKTQKKKPTNGQKEKTSEISSRRFSGHPAPLVTKQRNGFLRVYHFFPSGARLLSPVPVAGISWEAARSPGLPSHGTGPSSRELSQRSHTASQRCHPAPISRRAGIRVEVMLGDTGHDTRGLGHTPTHNLGLCANYNPQTLLHKWEEELGTLGGLQMESKGRCCI